MRSVICISDAENIRCFKRLIIPAFFRWGQPARRRFVEIEIKLTCGILSMSAKNINIRFIPEYLLNHQLVIRDGFELTDLIKIYEIYIRWNNNDFQAGTPKQEDFVQEWMRSNNNIYDYQKACDALEKNGLLYDDGYKYGSAWLKEELPIDVIRYLFSLRGDGDDWLDLDLTSVNEERFLDFI